MYKYASVWTGCRQFKYVIFRQFSEDLQRVNNNSVAPNKIKRNSNEDIANCNLGKSVLISQSHDIFTNLALEDWFYRNFDFTRNHILMLWTNNPCVVVGRHQNPFAEANSSKLKSNGIALARRNSGGGTVYHDLENINLTFFTPRQRYDRNYNLNIITRALLRGWDIKAEITTRDDIVLNGNKISGTAAKLGRTNAYHHCTLLVNTNKERLIGALVKDDVEIISRATTSIRSPVKNLKDANYYVDVKQLQTAIGCEYLKASETGLDVNDQRSADQQKIHMVNPTESLYPGLNKIRDEFASWEWRFGKTPKFTVIKPLTIESNEIIHNFKLKINVEAGKITEIFICTSTTQFILPTFTMMQGQPYDEEMLQHIVTTLKDIPVDNVLLATLRTC